jgi:sodium pump decarboxylase gamma subunit
MDMLFALILMVIGMGVVYTFLYILVWVMRGLRFFERLPGFKEPRPVEGQVNDPDEGLMVKPVRTGQAVGEDGDDKEIVAAAVSAYMMLQNREQGGPGPAGHPQNDLRKVTI